MKFHLVNKSLDKDQFSEILSIIRSENGSSVLGNLSSKNTRDYLNIIVENKNMELFVILNPNIIGYAIMVSKPDTLIKNFEKLKFKIFIDLFFKLKFFTLTNIAISFLNIDTLFLDKQNKHLMNKSVNLNLLAIEKKFQGQGLGSSFLKFIIQSTKFKTDFITCETNNLRSTNFYMKKLKFNIIGNKIRVPKIFKVLIKKIN
jgi:hypothetical protein